VIVGLVLAGVVVLIVAVNVLVSRLSRPLDRRLVAKVDPLIEPTRQSQS
jgi:hypothetical protein